LCVSKVYVGQLQAGEVDFVARRSGGDPVYIQVSYLIADEATREREFGTLRNIRDNYPKYVISLSPLLSRTSSEGITHLHLRQFLTEGLG
jgi:predicted AAA+ superfamily ATPase